MIQKREIQTLKKEETADIIGVLYLFLATVIPAAALHYFRRGTVVERLRTAE